VVLDADDGQVSLSFTCHLFFIFHQHYYHRHHHYHNHHNHHHHQVVHEARDSTKWLTEAKYSPNGKLFILDYIFICYKTIIRLNIYVGVYLYIYIYIFIIPRFIRQIWHIHFTYDCTESHLFLSPFFIMGQRLFNKEWR
jgi:hypothetical protein